jgi:hypothetical protein
VLGRLADRTTIRPTLDLPPGYARNNIRFVRVGFGPGPGPFPKTIVQALWGGDQWEVQMIVSTAVTTPGGGALAWTGLADSGRRWNFKHPSYWQVGPLVPQRLPASIMAANQFIVLICTGDDDLRTDPKAQPNSEIEVYANLFPGLVPGDQVLLDTGRRRHRDFVATYGAAGSDAAYTGSFKDWQCASATADAGGMIRRLTDIKGFSIKMIAGRREHPGLIGNDPFRGDDQWVLRDVIISVIPPGVTEPPFAGYPFTSSYHSVFSRLNIGSKLNKDRREWSADWAR